MYPRGIIYRAKWGRLHGEVKVAVNQTTKLVYSLARGLGAGLVAYFVIGLLFTFGPIVKEEYHYYRAPEKQPDFQQSQITAESITQVQQEALSLGLNPYFSLVIPQIEARANIIANVDTGNETEYFEALKTGVAHARGSYFPGQGKSIYLFAHSTDSPFNVAAYNAVFYLLRKLEVGDEVLIYFADKKYFYQVEQKLITSASDVSWLYKDFGEEKLILQTCYPPGTRLKRLLVVAGRQ